MSVANPPSGQSKDVDSSHTDRGDGYTHYEGDDCSPPTPTSLREQIYASLASNGINLGQSATDELLQAVTTYIEATNTSKVTRFEVIDHTKDSEIGRALVKYDVDVKLSFQDDNRTLKVFLTDQAQKAVLENKDD